MIKIIENPASMRLIYNDYEVFNHTDILPFAKSVKGRVVYGARRGKLTATYDCDGEFALTDYKVLSVEAKSANLKFSGYDDATLKINVVEEKDCLKMYFVPSDEIKGIKLNFITSVLERVLYGGEDIKGKNSNNLLDIKADLNSALCGGFARFFGKADNALSRLAVFRYPFTVDTEKGISYSFDGASYIGFDLTKKVAATYTFALCPNTLTVTADNKAALAFKSKFNI